MARKLPPPSGPAAPQTIKSHIAAGKRVIALATHQHPDITIGDAVVRFQEKSGPLAPNSVGRYRADLRYALAQHFADIGRPNAFEPVWIRVNAALSARKEPRAKLPRRTSALKVTDATEEEARALFYELKRHALAYGNPNALLAALFVLVAGHAGFRPIELLGASLSGSILTLPNAKKRPGYHQESRELDISALDNDVQKAIRLMLDLIDHDLDKEKFSKFQKVLAEQMRRACKRIEIRVLSLYSFRHVAIACWSASGLSSQEIARLCGHFSIETAHRHYAGATKGYKRRAVVRSANTPAPSAQPPADPLTPDDEKSNPDWGHEDGDPPAQAPRTR